MNRVRYGYAAAASIIDYYEYNVRICLALLYPPQALVFTPCRTRSDLRGTADVSWWDAFQATQVPPYAAAKLRTVQS